MSSLCRIAFCADMNSYLVQYEQQRHWTGQVVNIHQTSYWSSLPRRFGELNPNLHFRILLPYQWVPVLAASHLIPPQSEYLFTLWRGVAEMNPICDQLLYYVSGSPTWLCAWYRLIYCFTRFSGQFSKIYTSILVNRSFLAKEHFHYSIILIQK